MGEVATFSKGKGISKSEIEENGITECIRYGELYTHYGEVINEIKSKTNLNKSELVLSEANDVIIPASGETTIDIATASCVLKSGVALGGDLNIIKTEHNGVYLSYYLNSKKKVEIANLAQGISVVHLYSSQLATLILSLPKLEEQNRISSFFAKLDERITTQNKIIGELGVLKTNLAKKIFSQQLRFKDDNRSDFPDWEEKQLGDIGEFSGGGTPSSSNADFWNGDIPWISSSDLSENSIRSINITRFITESAVNNSSTKLCIAPLILVVSRVGVGKVAYSEESLCTSQDFLNIYNFSCNGLFLSYLLSIEMKKAASNTQGTSIKGISSTEIKSKQILLPCIAEQTKIANFFASIDTKIDIEAQLLQKLEEQKKFLLQNLFV